MFIPHVLATAALLLLPGLGAPDTIVPDSIDRHQAPAESLLVKQAPDRPGRVTCRGLPAVVVSPGETYHGSDDDDVIHVSGADARVYGHGGDDLICAVAEVDEGSRIYGGDGDDIIVALGSHLMFGDAGDDVILANGGLNEVWAGADDDVINGAGSSQLLAYGEDGDDIITGSPGPDWLGGYDGNDLIMGFDGDDLIFGMDGDDELRGGSGFDEIGGSNGDDTCIDHAGPVHGADISGCENVVISLGGGIDGLKLGG